VLVGPTGVFVIETKDWGGRFYRSGGRLMFNIKPADQVVGQVTAAARAARGRRHRRLGSGRRRLDPREGLRGARCGSAT